MTSCKKCILTESYHGIEFDNNGVCNLCNSNRKFSPIGESKLIDIFNSAKKKNTKYNVLVPLSGGKDSAYILHLAVNVYGLKVLTMTFDNGFLSQLAIDNINTIVEKTKVDHIFCRPNPDTLQKIYRHMLKESGDFCGSCDIGTRANILKVARDYSIPIILYGTSPLENDSFVPDSIQDIARFKHILSNSKELTKKEINDFLIYPRLNQFFLSLGKKTGYFAKDVSPLFYIDNPSDKEMGEIITKELGWKDDTAKKYSKHFDCTAEPLTNYIRNKIYGYERHICQYSNMIRRNEISREQALELLTADKIDSKPSNYHEILSSLKISEEELSMIEKIEPLRFESKTSRIDNIFLRLVRLKQRIG
ncbi:MAG: N-acetyl sugar amidotransferase [Bacteroidales bacterium]